MEARMKHPAFVVPGAMQALQALGKAVHEVRRARPRRSSSCTCGPARSTAAACASTCTPATSRRPARPTSGSSPSPPGARRPYFTDAERAALALSEAVTRLSDRADPVPDEVWDEAARHYDEEALAALTLSIANVNLWNRLNAATRQVAGAAW